MRDILLQSSTWGTVLTLAVYALFFCLQRKTKKVWCNPLLMSTVLIGAFLLAARIPYRDYKSSSAVISWLLLPATVSLALPMHEQWNLLRKNWPAVLLGILAGVVTSLLCIVLLYVLFHLDASVAASLLPKSVTTAVGSDISAALDGIPALTVIVIILTGIAGNLMAPWLCRLFRLKHPVARGIAIGSCSHAIGTARAIEMGETEGAMSSLAIVLAGVLTAFLAPAAARLFLH